jgi:hypothetical protein
MKASMVPFDAASKQSSGCMIWPLGKTSIRNRPSLISSTTFARRSAVPCNSFDRAQVVDMRHWTFGCAMTLGASSGSGGSRHDPACRHDEPASFGHHVGLLSWKATVYEISITRSPDPPAAGATARSSGRGPSRS